MIQKHQFKQVAAFAGLYFLAIGLGVLLGSLVDNRGNMFYAPAFSALVGGGIYRVYVEKIQRTGAILVVALVIGSFFLFSCCCWRSFGRIGRSPWTLPVEARQCLVFPPLFLYDDRAHSDDVDPTG